jgi:hypothetical protein
MMRILAFLSAVFVSMSICGCTYVLSDAPILAANVIVPKNAEAIYVDEIKKFGNENEFVFETLILPYEVKPFQLTRVDVRIEFRNAENESSGERIIALFDQRAQKLDSASILKMWADLKSRLLAIEGVRDWSDSEIDPSRRDALK